MVSGVPERSSQSRGQRSMRKVTDKASRKTPSMNSLDSIACSVQYASAARVVKCYSISFSALSLLIFVVLVDFSS